MGRDPRRTCESPRVCHVWTCGSPLDTVRLFEERVLSDLTVLLSRRLKGRYFDVTQEFLGGRPDTNCGSTNGKFPAVTLIRPG